MFRSLILAAILAVVAGCGDRPVAAPVDPPAARAALKQALDAWKAGQTIDSLKTASPEVIAQDFDWMAGATLTEYKVLDEGIPLDANLRVKVSLTVRDKGGKTATKQVAYIVGTDPKLTVFRAME